MVLGFSLRCPGTSLGEAAPGLGLWVLADYSCPLSECLGQPRGPLGHPQPAPGGSGSTLLPEPPARQGALNPGSRWARQQPPGALGPWASPLLFLGPGIPLRACGEEETKCPLRSGPSIRPSTCRGPPRTARPLASGPARNLPWDQACSGPSSKHSVSGETSGPFLLPLGRRLKLPGLQRARAETFPAVHTVGTASVAAGPLQQVVIRLRLWKALETPLPARLPL